MTHPHRSPFVANRRFFLRATGVSLALPLFESLGGRVLAEGSAVGSLAGETASETPPTRMVCIGNLLGFFPEAFFPKQTGSSYSLPKSVVALKPHQNDFTLFSGLDHGVKGGHFAMSSFLSGVSHIQNRLGSSARTLERSQRSFGRFVNTTIDI
jgi:Protein of unknown function (DUF1552)